MNIEELRAAFFYDPMTGIFTWVKKPRIGMTSGLTAGCKDGEGYIRLRLNGETMEC